MSAGKKKRNHNFFPKCFIFRSESWSSSGKLRFSSKNQLSCYQELFYSEVCYHQTAFRLRSYFGQLTKMLWLNQKYIIDTGSSGFEHLTFQSFSIYKVMEPWLRHSGAVVSIMIKGRNDYLPNKNV